MATQTHATPARSMILRNALLGSALVVGCLVQASCLFDPSGCTTEVAWGLRVTVRNALTGAPAGLGALVTATDGAHRETLLPFPDSLSFFGASERPGDYDVAVSRAGFQPWNRLGVEVRDGGCHVDTVDLDVRLQPLAGSPNANKPVRP